MAADKARRKTRARALRRQIGQGTASLAAGKKGAGVPGKESPREFIQRKMAELAKEKSRSSR